MTTPEPQVYAQVRRNIHGGWWAEVGWSGHDVAYRKARFTRLGALWAAKRMRRRVQDFGSY